MSKTFLSPSTRDDTLLRELQQAPAELDQPAWIAAREPYAGDPLGIDIGKAIDAAPADIALVTPAPPQAAGRKPARCQAEPSPIGDAWATRRLREALAGAQTLLERCRSAGEPVYPKAVYDLAVSCFLQARVLQNAGACEPALPLLDEARQRFEAVATARPDHGAQGMAAACLAEQGHCLRALGRLDEAAVAYQESIRRDEELGDERSAAIGRSRVGSVRLEQRRFPEALAAYAQARASFTRLNEPGSVAGSWQQTGRAYQEAGDAPAAEEACRQALAIQARLGPAQPGTPG